MIKHNEKAQPGQLPEAELDKFKSLIDSPYFNHLQELKQRIKGKTVVDSIGGHSGYCLYFDDGFWVLCCMVDNKLDYQLGNGELTEEDLALIHNEKYQDGRKPLDIFVPYAEEECIIAESALNTHGKVVRSVAVGHSDFSICFPDGWELEGHVISKTDPPTLRVYWEKWR